MLRLCAGTILGKSLRKTKQPRIFRVTEDNRDLGLHITPTGNILLPYNSPDWEIPSPCLIYFNMNHNNDSAHVKKK